METYRVVAYRDTYDVREITPGGRSRVVATYPTEAQALALVSRLHQKAALLEQAQRNLEDGFG